MRPGRYSRAAGLAVLVAVLAGCGDGIATGYVTSKEYTPAHDDQSLICAGYNQQGGCIAWVPVTSHYAAQYRLYLRDDQNRKGWVDVDPGTYARYDAGSHYPDPRFTGPAGVAPAAAPGRRFQ